VTVSWFRRNRLIEGDLDPALVAAKVAARMETFEPGWTVVGNEVIGPGTLAVHPAHEHKGGSDHIDLGFVLNRHRPDVPVIWDCAAGFGTTPDQVAERAVEAWATCTASVVFEFLTRTGEYAEHIEPGDPIGLPGWHCIHGSILGFGDGEGGRTMQGWVLDHPLLPALSDVLLHSLDRPELNGIKFLFGSGVQEVRINGEWNETASDALGRLDWPRLDPPAFARCFVLAVHGPSEP